MKLVFVPTPIGNLEDITLRSIRYVQEADGVLCEDTRVTQRLLSHLEIRKPLTAYHQHNEHFITEKIISRILAGEKLVVVSDAGTPGISDAGYLLAKMCLENGIEVECLPGPTAFVPALVNSGFPTDEFVFIGFLPHKKGRLTKLKSLMDEPRTFVLYESPHRLVKCLEELATHLGAERQVSVSRELTKLFEENTRGTMAEVISHYKSKTVKGEIVIVVKGRA